MKKIILSFILSTFVYSMSFSQDYQQAAGLRLGMYNGITGKMAIQKHNSIEGILVTRWGGFQIAGLFEVNNSIPDVKNLSWYYGAGAHFGFWNGNNVPWYEVGDKDSYAILGISGIVGIEYTFEEAPFNISLDWKPAFDLIGNSNFWADGIALSIRYIIKY